jgi:VWFA-related protein
LHGRKPDGRLFALTALAILALLAPGGAGRPPSSAQVKAQTPGAPLQHEVTVTLKLIQVFVTDANGKPALDLERSDFVITDNGKPQTITDFETHALALPAPGPAAPAAPVAAPAPSPKPEVPLLSRKFIFLIDYTRNGLQGVQKAKQAALEFLASKVGPDDEVALFTLSPMSGLTLYENLTKDQDKVRNKVSRLREFVGGGSDGPADDFTGMELMNARLFAIHGGHAGPTQRNLFTDVAEWAKALRAIPGQKNIIWFTMGYGTGAVRRGSLNNVLFEAMARALASANAPVFTVDTSPQAMPGREVWDKLPSGTLPERSLAYL